MLTRVTAQHREPPVTDRPVETPAAVRTALAASAVPEVLALKLVFVIVSRVASVRGLSRRE